MEYMTTEEKKTEKSIGLFKIFIVFFRIGLFTIGGGLAMVAVIRHELTTAGWLNDDEFVDCFSIATALPGVIAVNTSLIVGHKVRGILGGAVAMLGVVIPSFVVILLVAVFLLNHFKTPGMVLFFKGAGAAVAGLIAYVAFGMGKTILRGWKQMLLTCVGVFLGLVLKVNPLWIILTSAVAGYFLCNGDYNDTSNN